VRGAVAPRGLELATAWTLDSGDGIADVASARIVDPDIALTFYLAVAGKRKPPDAVAVVADRLRTLALAAAARPDTRAGARRTPSPP
jgi:hypothetical protein